VTILVPKQDLSSAVPTAVRSTPAISSSVSPAVFTLVLHLNLCRTPNPARPRSPHQQQNLLASASPALPAQPPLLLANSAAIVLLLFSKRKKKIQ
jgi:hypothetical protein